MNRRDEIVSLVMLLVGAGWRREKIKSLILSLQKIPHFEIEELFDAVLSIEREMRRSLNIDHTNSIKKQIGQEALRVGERVQFLFREAGLTNEQAVKELSARLRDIDKVKGKAIPGYSKTSLAVWVDRVSGLFSPSEILHVATMIRNERVHSSPLDWSLRKYES